MAEVNAYSINTNFKERLEIGGGDKPILHPNIDVREMENVDIVHNLDEFPYPIKDNSLELVIGLYVLEHINWQKYKDGSVQKELSRILKPGGIGWFLVPNTFAQMKSFLKCKDHYPCSFEHAETLFGTLDYKDNCHKMMFSPKFAEDLFRPYGFKVETVVPMPQVVAQIQDKYYPLYPPCETDMIIKLTKIDDKDAWFDYNIEHDDYVNKTVDIPGIGPTELHSNTRNIINMDEDTNTNMNTSVNTHTPANTNASEPIDTFEHTPAPIVEGSPQPMTMDLKKKQCLNIGSFTVMIKSNETEEWMNIDIIDDERTQSKRQEGYNFFPYDIRQSLPYQSDTIDFINSSHLIEHLSRKEGLPHLEDCYRVLKPGGKLRIGTPDLDKLAYSYIEVTMDMFDKIQPDGFKDCDNSEKFWRMITSGPPEHIGTEYWEGHKTIYSYGDLSDVLRKTGFDVGLPLKYNEKYDMFPEVSMYVEATKK